MIIIITLPCPRFELGIRDPKLVPGKEKLLAVSSQSKVKMPLVLLGRLVLETRK